MRNKKIILPIILIIGLLLLPLITAITYQYQENANEIACGGNPIYNCSLIYDGNWATASSTTFVTGGAFAYMNYTIPPNIEQTNSLWQIKIADSTYYNLTIPPACWDLNGKLILRLVSGTNYAGWTYYSGADCWNNSAWNVLAYKGHGSSSGYVSLYEEGIYFAELPKPTIKVNYPQNNQLLYRDTSPNLNITANSSISPTLNITFFNASDNSIICTNNSIASGSDVTCEWLNLTAGTTYEWYANATSGTSTTTTGILNFTPNDEPKVLNLRLETINTTVVTVMWENEPNMEWISFKIGSEIMEVRSITGTKQNWTVDVLYLNDDYVFEWQTGDDLLAFSDYYNFNFRSHGWKPDLTNYAYKRLITINHSQIGSDSDNYAVNITLTEDNFKYYESWVWYPSFKQLNWTTGNDIRFVDYYESKFLDYNITKWDVLGEGGTIQQTIPNATAYTGNFETYNYAHDDDWNTQATPNPDGTDYYNYTIPANAKTTSKFRIYDGAWGWDIGIPEDCFGGTDLRFKSVANYTIPRVITYCQNNSDSTNWLLVRDNNNQSAYIYETMVTWEFDCEANILIIPEHYDDNTQTYTKGIDSDYDTKLWIYYGYSNATNNETTLNEAGTTQTFIIGEEEEYTPPAPTISNINDTEGRTSTGTNISWTVDQITNNRIRYSTNQWLLDSTWANRIINVTENFEHIYSDAEITALLNIYSDYYLQTINVTCTNASHNSNYTINTSTNPVKIIFQDVNDPNHNNWTITYTMNKTWERNTGTPNFKLENLTTNTTYYYEVWSYGTNLNSSETESFTLGTPPTAPTGNYHNYTEDRPESNVTICFNITDLDGANNVTASIQYWHENDITFSETITSIETTGTFCRDINVNYGHTYNYRAKLVGDTIGYTPIYINEYMPIQEFFAGSTIEDDNDGRHRQYCPNGIGTTPCYEQKGYWEGSQQEEDWIWIETNISDKGILTVHWWDGIIWTEHNMTNDTDTNMQYLKLTGLNNEWQTFHITNQTSNLILNWTKPSPIHLENQNRIDESKYVSFNGTTEIINYTILYMDYKTYNSSAMRWCMATPEGNLYDCMAVEYFGGGRESGVDESLSGTEYDRGRLFRGGIMNGELSDTGVLNPERNTERLLGDNRYCYAFTIYWWNKTIIPTNNITNYYYRYWAMDEMWSDYMGHPQDRLFDFVSLFSWEYDLLSHTRDWKKITETILDNETEKIVLTTPSTTFNSTYDQSLLIGYKNGFEVDTSNDAIYNMGLFTDGRWTNQQIGKHQQGFVIFNLPDNTTLQGMDSDNDGLNDYEELYTYYTNPKQADTDEDGSDDGTEVTAGFNPNIPNLPPNMITTRTLPLSPLFSEDLQGYAKATDQENNNVTYYCNWSINGILTESGITGIYEQGIEVNISGLSSTETSIGDKITLSCLANDGEVNSTWLTSNITTIVECNNNTDCGAFEICLNNTCIEKTSEDIHLSLIDIIVKTIKGFGSIAIILGMLIAGTITYVLVKKKK